MQKNSKIKVLKLNLLLSNSNVMLRKLCAMTTFQLCVFLPVHSLNYYI